MLTFLPRSWEGHSRLRSGRARSTRALAALVCAAAAALCSAAAAQANTPVTGAAFTTVNENIDGTGHCQNGNPNVNCNIYAGKLYVWLNGGPDVAYVGDGEYFFAVLEPGGQADPNDDAAKNLSDGANGDYTDRTFTVSGGNVTYAGSHDLDSNKIRLMPYDDTSNPGGTYIMAICSLADGYPARASDCKYDTFKVKQGEDVKGLPLTVTKDAAGSDKNTFAWQIAKSADKTIVKQVGGNATFNYTVTATRDGGTISDVKVTGTISVFNPNLDDTDATVPVGGVNVTDTLSDGTQCTVSDGSDVTLSAAKTEFAYSCDLGALPQGELDNTVTVTWADQFLDNGSTMDAGHADFTFKSIAFGETKIDECVNVADSWAGPLGTACLGDANPRSFTYSRTIAVPQYGCQSYDNTATFTAIDTGATGSASQTVTVCGPAKTGALTIGFWQNKNGQGIITGGAAVSGVCKSGTWLRQYSPFQDLSATATCAQVGTYATNGIKAANASGAAMNAMLKAQMLATALDVYFSDPGLGANKINAPAPIGGVAIDLTLICKTIDGSGGTATCGGVYQNTSGAFGGATSRTVAQLLADAAGQSNAGGSVWYGQVKATQELAKNTFDAINNQVAFAA
jgi:hypothetical protein